MVAVPSSDSAEPRSAIKAQNPRLQPPSGLRAIPKVGHSIRKTALVQERQLYAYVAWQDSLAVANHSRHDQQLILVDEPSPDRVCGEGRTAYRNIVRQLSLQVANRLWVEFPLKGASSV